MRDRIVDPALLMVALMWGVGNVVIKWVVEVFDPAAFCALRMGVTAVLMIALLLSGPRRRLAARDWLMLVVFGGALVAAQQLSFSYAMRMTTASEGSLLISTAPLWTAVIVATLRMELVTRLNWLGIAVALGGVAMIIFGASRGTPGGGTARLSGDLLMIVSAGLYGGYMVISKRWMQRLGALQVICCTFAAAGMILTVVGTPRLLTTKWAEITWGHWIGIAYLTLIAGFIGLVVWYRTIARTSASGTAVYQYLVPGIAVIIAAIFLGERLAALQAIGFTVTLVGVCLARVPPRFGARSAQPGTDVETCSKAPQPLQRRTSSDT